MLKNCIKTDKRKLKRYELEYVTETDNARAYINCESYELEQGCVVFAKQGDIRHSKLHFKAYCIHFSIKTKELDRLISEHSLRFYGNSEMTFKVAAEMKNILALFAFRTNSAVSMLNLESALLRLLAKTIDLDKNEASVAFDAKLLPNVISKAISFMRANSEQHITLADIAESAYLTPNYFHKLFLKSTGITVHKFLTDLRLSRAAFLLASTDLSIAQISLCCGFSSQSHFSSVFKKNKKMTPFEYRKQNYMQY